MSGYDSQEVLEGRHGGDSPLPGCPRRVRTFNAPVGAAGAASQACGGGPTPASSEAEPRPGVHLALERGKVSPEGAPRPRARRSFAQGGI
jgi:hypothetical protein